eukprot:2392993-Pleurochrysis_carterae.AAC.2
MLLQLLGKVPHGIFRLDNNHILDRVLLRPLRSPLADVLVQLRAQLHPDRCVMGAEHNRGRADGGSRDDGAATILHAPQPRSMR